MAHPGPVTGGSVPARGACAGTAGVHGHTHCHLHPAGPRVLVALGAMRPAQRGAPITPSAADPPGRERGAVPRGGFVGVTDRGCPPPAQERGVFLLPAPVFQLLNLLHPKTTLIKITSPEPFPAGCPARRPPPSPPPPQGPAAGLALPAGQGLSPPGSSQPAVPAPAGAGGSRGRLLRPILPFVRGVAGSCFPGLVYHLAFYKWVISHPQPGRQSRRALAPRHELLSTS